MHGGEPGGEPADTQGDDSDGDPGSGASRGCDVEPPAPGRSEARITSGGIERTYLRYVPDGPGRAGPMPLVVDMPAYSPAALQEEFSGFTRPDSDGVVKADAVGAVVVTPEPVNGAGALLTWNYVGTDGWTDDQAFLRDVLDDVGDEVCIDTDRVLVMGFAVGAVMASLMACDQAERVAVLATVAGLYRPDDCAPSTPVPVVAIHGTADRFIPFEGGVGSGPGELGLDPETVRGLVFMASRDGAPSSSQGWADGNDCAEGPDERTLADGVGTTSWTGCADGADVELHVVAGGEHTWPGSSGMAAYEGLLGPVSDAIDANDVIWEFFERHAPR